jgi:zinc/manganese transport system substrate-binding protein
MNVRSMLIGAVLALGLAPPALAKMNVVATLPDLAAIAKEVGGDRVDVTALAEPSQDPHFVDARPSLILPLNKAKLLVVNGLELEVGWLPPLLVSARNPDIQTGGSGYFDASMYVERQEVPGAKLDRAEGDIHPGGNPHFVFDARAGKRIALALADRMGKLDPEGAATYTANANALAAKLDAFAQSEAARFRALPAEKRKVVPYHKSMTYLLDWLGLEAPIHVEPRPGIQPDPAHVAEVLKTMKAQGIHVVLQEEFYPRSTSETLTRLAGGQLVVIPGGTRFNDGQGYLDHLKDVTGKLYDALSR